MATFVTVLAALVIISPLVVLALRTTRWDPVARSRSTRPAPATADPVVADASRRGSVGNHGLDLDADDRRMALDVAAVAARRG